MAQRIVVAFETQLALGEASGVAQHWRELLVLRERAEVRGGRLCALAATTVAFDFAPEELEEAISLAVTEHGEGESAAGAAQLHWAIGIAQGEIASLVVGRSVAALGWGRPLVVASALAACAAAGEVLLDGDLPAVQRGEVSTYGTRLVEHHELRLRGVMLDARIAYPYVPPRVRERTPRARPALRSGALAALSRGEMGDALLTLESAVRDARDGPPHVRCRALLALAVGMAFAGRATEALLASLQALARAREAGDAVGERACLQFLARLTSAAGHAASAQRWAAAIV